MVLLYSSVFEVMCSSPMLQIDAYFAPLIYYANFHHWEFEYSKNLNVENFEIQVHDLSLILILITAATMSGVGRATRGQTQAKAGSAKSSSVEAFSFKKDDEILPQFIVEKGIFLQSFVPNTTTTFLLFIGSPKQRVVSHFDEHKMTPVRSNQSCELSNFFLIVCSF